MISYYFEHGKSFLCPKKTKHKERVMESAIELKVNYDKSLNHDGLMGIGHYSHDFREYQKGVHTIRVQRIKLDQRTGLDEVKGFLRERGLRSARLRELAAFGESLWDGKGFIFVLDEAEVAGCRDFPYLQTKDGAGCLRLMGYWEMGVPAREVPVRFCEGWEVLAVIL